MMAKENKNDKQLRKIAELDKQIDHDKKELLNASEIRQTDGSILNLASGVYFANAYEVNYFSGGSSEKYNQYMGPYAMHWHMINYCFDNGYDRYNFMVYLVTLLKIVKIMVFIASREDLMFKLRN